MVICMLAVSALLLAACSTFDQRNAVPPELRRETTILGIPNARFFVDQPAQMSAEQQRALIREAKYLRARPGEALPNGYFLSLSGGGDDGAFGAGLLVGWTAHGDRPSFKLVTGVSTGALIAPFAFLGSEYDAALTDVYTNLDQSKVFEKRFITAAVTDDALSDTAPLYATISKYVDERMMARIAEEYGKGRLLAIQTTDLDGGYPVIWNIGAIAKTGTPEALNLIRHILLASASIPAAFPPVLFDVEARGAPYQEMHVDGGAVSQAFLVPPSLNPHIAQAAAGYHRKMTAYIIRNSRLTTDWTDVERQTLSIAQRAVSTMINYNGVGDFYRMYLETRRANAGFNLAYIGDDFHAAHKEQFDQGYMRALYRYAFDKAAKGYPWQDAPPGFAHIAH
jgi:predicted patatin/cPLA2 family phospholipase